jgi:outer membrane lipoprotein SlyB
LEKTMNAPGSSSFNEARRGLHPLVAIASVCVIALCAVAIAAIAGWLPSPNAQQEAAQASAGNPEDANRAPLPGTQQAMQQPPAQAPSRQQAQNQVQGRQQAQGQAQGQMPPAAANCPQCGTVVSVNQVQVPVQDKSNHIVGTVAGGVVGGVVGNQFGGGHGRTALTVLGAVGGALAGREIERNINQQQTVTRYQLVARTNDGRTHTFRSDSPFQYAPGQAIRVENNQLQPG